MVQNEGNRVSAVTDEESKVFAQIITEMCASFQKEDEQRYKAVVDAVEKKFASYNMTPEDFSVLVTFDILEKLNTQFVLRLFPQYAGNRNIQFVIEHYNFIYKQIGNLVDEAHGYSTCCFDCARWVIKEYIKHLQDKTYFPDMVIDEKCYWKPDFGTGDDWMRFCMAIQRLYHGEAKEFCEMRTRLLNVCKHANA